jgi:hypothetical protein
MQQRLSSSGGWRVIEGRTQEEVEEEEEDLKEKLLDEKQSNGALKNVERAIRGRLENRY